MTEDQLNNFKSEIDSISNHLSRLNQSGCQSILIIEHKGISALSGWVINSEVMSEVINQTLNTMTDKIKAGQLPVNHPTTQVIGSLVVGVMKHLNALGLSETSKKYEQFKSGNVDGLTSDEVSQFIDMKLAEERGEELGLKIQDELVNIFYELADEYNISDKDIRESLHREFVNLFNQFSNEYDTTNYIDKSRWRKRGYELINKLYKEDYTDFYIAWFNKIIEYIG